MTTLTRKPVLHGRDHLPGGPDPIPGFLLGMAFPDAIADISEAHPGNLVGYWRLGEPSGGFADTSGHDPADPRPAAVRTPAAGPNITRDIVGALSEEDDDGAVQFNSSDGGNQYQVYATDPVPRRFNLSGPMTVALWVKPRASASTFHGHAFGQVGLLGGGPAYQRKGWQLGVTWPERTPHFKSWPGTVGLDPTVSILGAPLDPDEWVFLVGTYDSTDGWRLYVNGALVGSDPSTAYPPSGPINEGVWWGTVNTGGEGTAGSGHLPDGFYGGVDETSLWTVALDDVEIGTLFSAGTGATGGAAGPPGPPGATGPPGPTGSTGPQGPPGFSQAGYSDLWSWTTSTTAAASSGQIGVNAATWAAATRVHVNEQTKDGRDMSRLAFPRFRTGDQIYLQHKTDSSRYAYYTITGPPTDNGTWWSWPVTVGLYGGAVPGGTTDTNLTWLLQAGFAPSDPASDLDVWMPLFDDDGALLLDDDGGLIPTLIPIA